MRVNIIQIECSNDFHLTSVNKTIMNATENEERHKTQILIHRKREK